MGFWLELGVSGFRIDAAPFLIELRGLDAPKDTDKYQYLKEFRQFLSWRKGNAIMLAEANVPMDKVDEYFGDGNKLHMLFHFMLNQYTFLSLVRQDASYLREALKNTPDIPNIGQWAIFLRNHDELDLGRLSKEHREEAFEELGPKENMQIYHRGIRRRLAPMLDNDPRRIKLANSLMLTLPGSPVIYYGEEIGMGDDLSLSGRSSVRTPMQWSSRKNAGFSSAPEDNLIRPVIKDSEFGYKNVNYADQSRDEDSLLHWMRRALRARQECEEFGAGNFELIDVQESAVLAHRCWTDEGEVMAIHNLSDKEVSITLNFDSKVDHLLDVLGNKLYKPEDGARKLTMEAYGYHWLRVI